jgi:hypothetical protein
VNRRSPGGVRRGSRTTALVCPGVGFGALIQRRGRERGGEAGIALKGRRPVLG